MVIGVRAIASPALPFIEGAGKDGLMARVWTAVVDFFKVAAQKIKAGAEAIWTTMQKWRCCKIDQALVAPAAIRISNPGLAEKLAPYAEMPKNDVAFLKKTIANLRSELQRNAPNQLQTFNEDLDSLGAEGFQKMLIAAVRAFVFSGNIRSANQCPSFLRGRKQRVDDEPFFNPELNQVVLTTKDGYKECFTEAAAIRGRFLALSAIEKETIIDHFDEDIDRVQNADRTPLSANGKAVLRDIGALSNTLVQYNKPFYDAAQGAL